MGAESSLMASFSLTARAVPALTGRIRDAPAAWTFLAVGVLAIGVYFLLPPNAQSIYYVVVGFSAVTAVYVGTVRNLPRGERLPWHLFALGLLGQVAGDAIFAVYEVQLNREPPLPSIADAFYLAGYPLLAAGVFLILRRLGAQTSRAAILDTIVIFCGVALVQWVFFIEPYNHMHFGSEGARLVSMAYPAMDALLLVALAQLLVGPGGRTVAYRMLLVSVGLWVVADEIYGLNTAGYQGGAWIDALWLGSYVVWGAAALEPSMARIAEPDRRRLPRLTTTRAVLLAAALLTAPAILLIERASHHRVHAYVLGIGGAVLSIVVLLRLAGLVRAVERAGLAERIARREAEQAQRLLTYQNEQLVELDTLKDEFVSSVSHELRTPLDVDLGLRRPDARRRGRRAEARVPRHRRAQRAAAARSSSPTCSSRRSSRAGGSSSSAARSTCTGSCSSRSSRRGRAPRRRGSSSCSDAEAVPSVDGEAVRLAQLLDNLVSNAIKFTPGGGRVSVHLSPRDGLVRFEISDTGIGIPEDERERLFERFFRSQTALERQIQGTGLGLYISKAIVEAHGGRIGVAERAGRGHDVRRRAAGERVSDAPLIVCADDDEDILSLVSLRLERAGFRVVQVVDGDSGARSRPLAPAGARGARRDDAEATGYEVLAALRADPVARRPEGDPALGPRAGSRHRARPGRGRRRLPREAVQGGRPRREGAGAAQHLSLPILPREATAAGSGSRTRARFRSAPSPVRRGRASCAGSRRRASPGRPRRRTDRPRRARAAGRG